MMKKLEETLSNELMIIIFSITIIAVISIFEYFSSNYWALWISLILYIVLCIFYSITFFSSNANGEKLTWFLAMLLIFIVYFALIYKNLGIIDTSTGLEVKPDWWTSLYFSVVTWTTLGYGDFKPNDMTRPWVMVEALMGYVFTGLLVGKLILLGQLKGLPKDE